MFTSRTSSLSSRKHSENTTCDVSDRMLLACLAVAYSNGSCGVNGAGVPIPGSEIDIVIVGVGQQLT